MEVRMAILHSLAGTKHHPTPCDSWFEDSPEPWTCWGPKHSNPSGAAPHSRPPRGPPSSEPDRRVPWVKDRASECVTGTTENGKSTSTMIWKRRSTCERTKWSPWKKTKQVNHDQPKHVTWCSMQLEDSFRHGLGRKGLRLCKPAKNLKGQNGRIMIESQW